MYYYYCYAFVQSHAGQRFQREHCRSVAEGTGRSSYRASDDSNTNAYDSATEEEEDDKDDDDSNWMVRIDSAADIVQ